MQIVSVGDNLREVSDPIYYKNEKHHQFDICWICP